MCSRYGETQCSVCRRFLDQSSCRIIVEICGHQKCRECFINEEDGCSVCKQSSKQKQITSESVRSVSRENISHTSTKSAIDQNNEIDGDDGISSESEIKTNFPSKSNENVPHIIPSKNANGKILSYRCNICEKSFKSRTNQKYHIFCDKNRTKPFQCNQCNKQFITISHLKYHESTHKSDQNFNCKHCGRTYTREVALKKHMRKHEGITYKTVLSIENNKSFDCVLFLTFQANINITVNDAMRNLY